jgi:hypothetical protein
MIREYEAAGYFPVGDGRSPLDEQIPTPAPGEVVVFRDYFTCGLKFACDPMLVAILEKFSVKIINFRQIHSWSYQSSFGS